MGHKTNPIGFRLGVNRTWESRWYANKNYKNDLVIDLKIRNFIKKEYIQMGIARVIIERPTGRTIVNVYTPRPGVFIGKKGVGIDQLKKQLTKINKASVAVNVLEVRKPEIDAHVVAQNIATQLERRIAFRRAMKRAMQSALRLGALGFRVSVAGRLAGAEIARKEWYKEGRVPLHTLRSDIDYATAIAYTTYGIIGVKVWIYKGEILEHDPMAMDKRMKENRIYR